MKKRRILIVVVALIAIVAIAWVTTWHRRALVLTGIVTTDEVIVSAEIQGRVQQLAVQQGDTVRHGQLLATIAPGEWKADLAYYDNLARSAAAQVGQAESELKFQEEFTRQQVTQAEASLAAAEAQAKQAEADQEIARLNFERAENLRRDNANSQQELDQARTGYQSAQARVAAMRKQIAAAAAAVELAKAGAAQIAVREAAVAASRQQLAAAAAQKEKASVRYGYTELRAPTDGTVNVRAALAGEVVNPGQPVVTLIDPNNLWVRADVEETYIDRIHLGDKLRVRLPSGAERDGIAFFRGIDADFATQRDVSRTKRDIKTFEVRLRCENRDRALAVGMTAYVTLPFSP